MNYHTTWGTMTELVPDMADGHKSFYGKAYTRQGSALTPEGEYVTVRELYSYGTKVAAIYLDPYDGPTIIVGRPHLFSATTGRHLRCFTRRNADGIAYGIAAIRKVWNDGPAVLNDYLVDSHTWNSAVADRKGYRF